LTFFYLSCFIYGYLQFILCTWCLQSELKIPIQKIKFFFIYIFMWIADRSSCRFILANIGTWYTVVLQVDLNDISFILSDNFSWKSRNNLISNSNSSAETFGHKIKSLFRVKATCRFSCHSLSIVAFFYPEYFYNNCNNRGKGCSHCNFKLRLQSIIELDCFVNRLFMLSY